MPTMAICLTMPTMQIVRGSYLPIASTYSKGLKDLVDMTLRTDPKRRPTVNEVLKTPVLQERIAKFLSATVRSASRNTATRKVVSVAIHDHVMMCVLLLEGATFTLQSEGVHAFTVPSHRILQQCQSASSCQVPTPD